MFSFFFRSRPMLPMPYKRELHCHIIPGVDDGSPEITNSMNYLTSLEEMGVERVIFTPHHTEPHFMNTPEIISPIFDQVRQELAAQGRTIVAEDYSFEYRLDESFLKMADGGGYGDADCQLRPLFGNNLLIENSFSQPLMGLDNLVYNLQSKGFSLIMAHPERYHYYTHRGLRAYELLQDRGIDFQCNILSFAGYYGSESRKMAYELLEEGFVNYLGSDLHNRHHVELIEKFLRTKEYERLLPDLERCLQNDQF